MIGTTSSGFEYDLDEGALNDMEVVDLAVEIQKDSENLKATVEFYDRIIGAETKKRLYDHLRDDNGRVPVKRYFQECTEMIIALKSGKN